MLFDILPVHISYFVEHRESSSWFLKKVLGLNVIRHEEFKLPHDTSCPTPLDNRWCKTLYAYGPPPGYFAIQQVYCYNGYENYSVGNDFIGSKVKSLKTIARAKAIGIEGYEQNDGSFYVPGKLNCHGFWLSDHLDHEGCDPFAGETLRVADLKETYYYWHSFLGVDVVDLQNQKFTVFFRNNYPLLTFEQSPVPLVMSPAHLGFTVPRDQLKELSNLMLRSGTEVHQPYSKMVYEGRNADYLVILKDPSGYFLYFYDLESFEALSKFDPKADSRFVVSLLRERQVRMQMKSSRTFNDINQWQPND